MSLNWYPIISGKCIKCLACVVACPKSLLMLEKNQILLSDGEKCPNNCQVCKAICPNSAINFYDGTNESLMAAFSGTCDNHNH